MSAKSGISPGKSIIAALLIWLLVVVPIKIEAQIQILNKLPGKLNPQKDVEDELAKYLGGELPLKLDAIKTYGTVDDSALPGGPFQGKPLEITADTLMKPLAPGDYVVAITPFCSEYSVHQPGRNIAYTLGPVQGKLSAAIATLLWRGAFVGLTPQKIQLVSWAVQSGTPYGSMPPTYQAVVDQLLPDFKTQLQGNYVDQGKAAYAGFKSKVSMMGTAGTALHLPGASHLGKFPPLDVELAKMGTFGRLMLDAERQQQLITAQYTTEQLREQALFGGQGTPLPPQPAVSGAWTVKTANAAYMRFKVGGGNLSTDNTLEIRILPQAKAMAAIQSKGPHLVRTAYQISGAPVLGGTEAAPTLLEMLGVNVNSAAFEGALTTLEEGGAALVAGEVAVPALIALALAVTAVGIIGYSQGVGAQALILTLPAPLLAAAIAAGIAMAMVKTTKQSQKDKSSEFPSWIKNEGYLPIPPGDDCDTFAKNAVNKKWSPGTPRATARGPGSDYQQIKKACQRGGIKKP